MGLAADDLVTELLVAVAQLALGVAGFSGIAMYFKRRPGRLTDIEVYRIAILVFNGGAAMFLALIPFPLQAFGLAPEVMWRTGSAVMAAFELSFLWYYLPRSQRYRRRIPELFSGYSLLFTYTGSMGTLLLQALNALGLAGPRHAAVFMLGLVWLLFHAAFQFGRILFVQLPAEDGDLETTLEAVTSEPV
jgi:hypothetical protein